MRDRAVPSAPSVRIAPSRNSRRRAPRLCAAAVLLLAGLSPGTVASAADNPRPSKEDPATVASGSIGAGLDLSIASLQARVKKIEASQVTPDDSASQALKDYGAAIDQLQLAAEWKQRAEALSRLQVDGPRLLETTRSEVETWSRPSPTTVSADSSQSEVESQLAEADAKLSVLRKGLLDVDAELAQLAERRLSLPADLAAAGAAREGLLGEIDLPPLPTGSVEGTLAQRALALARQRASAEQAAALELELATYEMRRELLTTRRDLLKRKADSYSARTTELQAALAAKRLKEAEDTAAEARADQASLARVHPILGSLAEENARLTAERTGDQGLNARIDAAARELSSVADQLQALEERSKGVRQKVAAAGLTDAIGLLLRKEKGELPDADRARADMRARRDEIASVQLEALNLEDLLKALPAVESEVQTILASQAETLAPDERARIEASAQNVLKTRRSYLDALIRDYNSYFASLVDLDAKQAELVRVLEDYEAFLDQHVLWIPNASFPKVEDARDLEDAALWLVDPRHYAAAARRVVAGARSAPVRSSLAVLLLVASVAYRRRLKRLHAQACDLREAAPMAIVPRPAVALVAGGLLALPGPFAMKFVSWLATIAPLPPDDFSRASAAAIAAIAFPLLVAEMARRATSPHGILAAFFSWPRAALLGVRGQVIFAETVALPCFLVAALLDSQPHDDWSEALGRLAFCVGVGAATLSLHRVLSPRTRIVEQVLRRTELEWLGPMLARVAWAPAVSGILVIVLALVGYYYTALEVMHRVWLSSLVMVVFLSATASALRWLEGQQEASATAADGAAPVPGDAERGDAAEPPEAVHAIAHVSAQTRSLLRAVFTLALVAGLFSVWVDVVPALRFFETIELWQVTSVVEKTVGSGDAAHLESAATAVPVTVANLLIALLGAVLAVVGARNLPGFLELVVLSRLKLDRGLRYAIATVTRYTVFLAGSVVALKNLGVDWSSVQWMVAAVSVGLGFGLQEIFGNFVSGLIVLFERPVRIGDTVTIDGMTGTVSRIEIRATTILDGDRRELIVPNKDLITGRLVNWSLHDPTTRLVIPVGVAYQSDTATVVRLLQEVAKQCATVLENPPPMVMMTGFGDSSLDFELRVFLGHPDLLGPTRHDLLMEIERRFRAAGIEIPFPQRDVNLRTTDAAAVAARERGDAG